MQIPSNLEMGVDEAGRGPLIGRVYAAAVILDPAAAIPTDIKDSKKLTAKRRDAMRAWIEKNALAWGVGWAEPSEIDGLNILNATYLAMHRAIDLVRAKRPDCEHIMIDGNRYKGPECVLLNVRCVVKADATWAHVAAASILAKEYHDQHIEQLVKENPDLDTKYDLLSNKGYSTQTHMKGLREHGPSEHHRKTFGPVAKAL